MWFRGFLLLIALPIVAVVCLPQGYKEHSDLEESTASLIRATTQECSMQYCTFVGAHANCKYTIEHNRVITCGMFSHTPLSRHQCDFFCAQICLPPHQQPRGSNGLFYCTVCHLRKFSCSVGYTVYGPVPRH